MRVRAGSPSSPATCASMSVSLTPTHYGPRRASARRDALTQIEAFHVDSRASRFHTPDRSSNFPDMEDRMLTLCIRYTLDPTKLADFETYARSAAAPIERCGGKMVGYFAPTKYAGA